MIPVLNKFLSLVKSKLGCGYVWGAPRIIDKPEIITAELLEWYKRTFGASHYTTAGKWIGREAFDCSGLVVWALSILGLIKQDYTAAGIYGSLCNPIGKDKLQPGDLCFRKRYTIEHVGVYIGNGRVVHARGTFYGVVGTALFDSFNLFGRLRVFWKDEDSMIDKVKEFQRRNDLVVDGIIGPKTKAEAKIQLEICNYILNYKEAVKPMQKVYKKVSITGRTNYSTIRRGSKGQDVMVLQEQLREMSYYTGKIDGNFGPKTDDAVRYAQKINGLAVDGIVGAKTWGNILCAHVYEVDPMSLRNEIAKLQGNKIKGDYINSIFFDMNKMAPLGNMVNDGKLLAKQKIYNEQGKPHDYVKRGNLIVYKDGTVAVKMVMDIGKEEDLSKIRFAVSGFNMEPLNLKAEWQPESIGRTTWRSMLGYNKSTGKINAVVMANCSAVRGRKMLDKLGCSLKLGLDSGDSTNARFGGKDVRLTSRKLYGIIRFG